MALVLLKDSLHWCILNLTHAYHVGPSAAACFRGMLTLGHNLGLHEDVHGCVISSGKNYKQPKYW